MGGTKVAVAAVDGVTAKHAAQQPTVTGSTGALLDGIEATVRGVIEQAGEPEAIGVGVPSQIDYATGTVETSVNIPLTGVRCARSSAGASACRSSSTTTPTAPRSPRLTYSARTTC